MTIRTWLGQNGNKNGDINLASNPGNWSPFGTPAPGDVVDMSRGTMDIVGDAMAGVLIDRVDNGTSSPATINLSGGRDHMTLGVQGTGFGSTAVNLASLTTWIGDYDLREGGGMLTIQGAGVFQNVGTSTVIENDVYIGTAVAGAGRLVVLSGGSVAGLEVGRGVAAAQHVTVGSYGTAPGVLAIDNPGLWHSGDTTLGFGQILLRGIHASIHSLHNDLLSLYDARGALVYSMELRLDTVPERPHAVNFGVSEVTGGIIIHADGPSGDWSPRSQGVLLPEHP